MLKARDAQALNAARSGEPLKQPKLYTWTLVSSADHNVLHYRNAVSCGQWQTDYDTREAV
jgi:hypothetical protein